MKLTYNTLIHPKTRKIITLGCMLLAPIISSSPDENSLLTLRIGQEQARKRREQEKKNMLLDGNSRAFSDAADEGDETKIVQLKASGADINWGHRYTALQWAIMKNKGFELLIKHGADPKKQRHSTDSESLLYTAVRFGRYEIVQQLLTNYHADPNQLSPETGYSMLSQCDRAQSTKIAKALIQADADVDFPEPQREGRTALFHAAWLNNLTFAQLLVTEGANIDIRSDDGWTPLTSAVFGANPEMIKLLAQFGADVTVADNEGKPLLDYAVPYRSHNGCARGEAVRGMHIREHKAITVATLLSLGATHTTCSETKRYIAECSEAQNALEKRIQEITALLNLHHFYSHGPLDLILQFDGCTKHRTISKKQKQRSCYEMIWAFGQQIVSGNLLAYLSGSEGVA